MLEISLLSVLGFAMGLITSISGGAGVFAVPTLLSFGIPPVNVLAMNRMSDVGVVLGALRNFYKAKVIDWKLAIKIIPFLAAGSYLGASIVVGLSEESLRPMIFVGVLIGMIFLVKPARPFVGKKSNSKVKKWVGFLVLLLVGVWSGALAMAGATFALLVVVHFFEKNFVDARSTELVAAIPETLISTGILVSASTANSTWLFTIFISSFFGAFLGSHLAVKRGDSFIKKGVILIGVIMLFRLIYQYFS
ncbi:MAG: sulfite exporter TauE/SafE family protein [bacterium]|nr:sulfite exporter TauE/SafE family protein [bacterium]